MAFSVLELGDSDFCVVVFFCDFCDSVFDLSLFAALLLTLVLAPASLELTDALGWFCFAVFLELFCPLALDAAGSDSPMNCRRLSMSSV